MVDYSKWDNIIDSDSDNDDSIRKGPIVQTLQHGERVHIGPQGTEILDSKPSKTIVNSVQKSSERPTQNNIYINETSMYSWNQSRYDVKVKIPVESNIKTSTIAIRIDAETKKIDITTGDNIILTGLLRFHVDIPEEGVDWELATIDNSKFILLTLQKRCYIQDSVVWWDSFLVDGPKIDISNLKQRNTSLTSTWQEAHEMFRNNMKNMKKVDVDIDDTNDDNCEENNVKSTI
jgi:hypothetical protein